MRARLALVVIGIGLAVAGLWVSSNPIQINEGNQCGADGCQNVVANVPSLAPGMVLFVAGFLVAVYGARKHEDEGD